MAEAAPGAALWVRHWKAICLVLLGCLFWLGPLVLGAHFVLRFGPVDDLGWLVAIPAAMIVLTILTGWLAVRSLHAAEIFTGATAIAILAALCWVGILGQGI